MAIGNFFKKHFLSVSRKQILGILLKAPSASAKIFLITNKFSVDHSKKLSFVFCLNTCNVRFGTRPLISLEVEHIFE